MHMYMYIVHVSVLLQPLSYIIIAVYVPPGQFAFIQNSTLNIPRGVTLQGTYRYASVHVHCTKECIYMYMYTACIVLHDKYSDT